MRAARLGLLLVLALAGCTSEGEPAAPPAVPGGAATATVPLVPLPVAGPCAPPPARRRDVSLHWVIDAMGVFRRTQHANDAAADFELRGLPAGDADPRATRNPRGVGGRLLLVPTHTVTASCEVRPQRQGPAGACLVAATRSRCFDMEAIRAGRAAALEAPGGDLVGLASDGIDRARVETSTGRRTEVSVVENAFRADLGPDPGAEAVVTLLPESLDGCGPSAAMLTAAPALRRPPEPGGVPEIVRRSIRADYDSRAIAKYARIWGGGDGITYWVTVRLRCEVAALREDLVCITPVKESYGEASSACTPAGEQRPQWIHFPDGDVAAIAGFAPPGAEHAIVRLEDGVVEMPVRERMFGGRLEGIPLRGEVGFAQVTFR